MLAAAHAVQAAVQRPVPRVQSVVVHMEPYEPRTAPSAAHAAGEPVSRA